MYIDVMCVPDDGFADGCEKTVSVLLDGEETMMDFVDVAAGTVSSDHLFNVELA